MMKALKWQLTKETAPLPSKAELDDVRAVPDIA